MNPGSKYARLLQVDPRVNNGTTGGGLAYALQKGLAGYLAGKDTKDKKSARAALLQGMSAKPWVDPDTGKVSSDPAGGLKGGAAALRALGENDYAQDMLFDIMMQQQAAKAARDEKLDDREWMLDQLDYANNLRRLNAEEKFKYDKELAKDRLSAEHSRSDFEFNRDAKLKRDLADQAELRRLNRERQEYGYGPLQELPRYQSAPGTGEARIPAQPITGQPKTLADMKREAKADEARAAKAAEQGGVLLTPAQKKVDDNFAKDYVELIAGGGMADVDKGLAQLDVALKNLESGSDNITGPIMGSYPDSLLAKMYPQAAETKAMIEEVVQRNLRLVLGAQFTAEEGKRLIERAYDSNLEEAENARRVRRLRDSIAQAAKAKMEAARYYEQNGTLKGYQGSRLFEKDKFLDAVGGRKESQDDPLGILSTPDPAAVGNDVGRY